MANLPLNSFLFARHPYILKTLHFSSTTTATFDPQAALSWSPIKISKGIPPYYSSAPIPILGVSQPLHDLTPFNSMVSRRGYGPSMSTGKMYFANLISISSTGWIKDEDVFRKLGPCSNTNISSIGLTEWIKSAHSTQRHASSQFRNWPKFLSFLSPNLRKVRGFKAVQ